MSEERGGVVLWTAVVLFGFSMLGFVEVGQAANTGTLSGNVHGSDGNLLSGVTIAISSEALIGGPQVAVSGSDGRFSFHLLPVGSYTVEASLVGFQTTVGEVRVMSNRVGSVGFHMIPESFSGEIAVTADVPVVDTAQVNTGVIFDDDYLQLAGIGIDGRDYLGFLRQAPGVTGGSGHDPLVFGSTSGENSYLIDGMNTTDFGDGTHGRVYNIDAVQELNFQTGGFEAEFGQATGGIINLVSKSGGNAFSGSFDARYRSRKMTENGEHFDREELTSSLQQYSATLGGPILRDRLWFFSSLLYTNEESQTTFAHFPSEIEGSQFMGKMTWQAMAGARVIFKYSTDPVTNRGANSSQFVLDSARETRKTGGDLWFLELNSVLSEDWLLLAQAGGNSIEIKDFPTDNPNTVSGHRNEDTFLSYNNGHWSGRQYRPGDEIRVSATWLPSRFAGSHELKAGVGYSRWPERNYGITNGGAFVTDYVPTASGFEPIDLNGDGYFNHYLEIPEPEDRGPDEWSSSGSIASFFLQDGWRPHPRLTIKPGVRLDHVVYDNNVGERIADMKRWQPRLGLAWDVTGTARHVIRFSLGRFMDPTSTWIPILAGRREDQLFREYNTLEYYCNQTRGVVCSIDDVPASWNPRPWTNWAGQEYVLIDNRAVIYPGEAVTLDQAGLGRLQAPYSDQLILAYEAQIAPDVSIELSRVFKRSGSLIEDTCIGNEWAYGAAPLPSLDDPSTWTYASDCGSYLVANVPGLERRYDAWILRGEARKRWGHLMVSYTHADSRGNSFAGPQLYSYPTADFFPVGLYNIDGKMPDHRNHRVKINGYLLLPGRFTIGINGFWSSAGNRTVASLCGAFMDAPNRRSTEDQMDALGIDPATMAYCTTPDGANLDYYPIFHWPRGSLTTKSTWQVDLQLAKTFGVGRIDLTAILTINNVFNHEWDLAFNSVAFLPATDADGNELNYQDDDPGAHYYDEYYGADGSPVLVPIGAPTSYREPRRYEIGLRIEF